jgi:hypothetical protein
MVVLVCRTGCALACMYGTVLLCEARLGARVVHRKGHEAGGNARHGPLLGPINLP